MKLKNYLLIVITFLVNSIPIFNWFEVFFRLKFTKGNSKLKETMFVSPILKTFLVFITAFVCLTSNAQNYKPFTIRYNKELKGNMLLIGNNILGKNNNALNDNSVNQSTNMQYIDIDSDATTFSSSSANLKMPATTTCFKIAYAGLYWGAILQVPQSRTDINKIKLKLPGNTTYKDITGELIYDAVVAPIAAGKNEPTNTPYACYADVTTLVSGLANPQGTFTVANVTSSLGSNSSTGLSAGWTLFVVYEDAKATTKSITTFDGFSSIYDDKTLSIPISGFTTPPSGVIDIQYAFASLEGDKGEIGSKTEINGKAIVNAPQRASNKFFNSAITDANGYFTDRVPSSSNTLGYDTGIESVLSAEKSVINHNATSATITVQVAKGQADPVFSFFNAFAVDVIAPDIALTKTVEDASGNDASNANVTLGQNLYYEINYQNIGNDHVANFTIKDILPENIIFNYPGDIDLTNSGGATVQSYNPLTRTIIFSIPNTSVEINDPQYTIRIKVQVVPTCNELSNACSNEIKNQAFATYRGIVNTNQITDDASFSTTICNFGTAQPTNFLVGITNCTFQRTEVLCGVSVVLSASDGYASYSWSTSPTGTPVIGTAQTYTATQTGVYYVRNTASGTCLSIDEEITVVPYGNTITNPVIPFADLLPICPNNGKVLPNIFLCGANATRLINTGISDAASIVWQKLNESSCAAVTVANCANENSACTWNQVGTGPNYTANTAGQFRVTINYVGGCYSVFYFNVYQNVLNPTVTSQDIICNTLGQITVGGVPGGYEYSLNVAGPYQTSNVFSITTPNSYTVYIKQVGVVTNPCIFTVPDILIRKRDFTVSKFVTQPLCNGGKGAIKLAANDIRPQYYFSIYQGATLVNGVGPIMANDYEFSGLTPGIYTARVWTDDGCDYSEDIEIINPPLLTATSALTKPLTCTDGEITVYPVGGIPPYTYYINGTSNFQSTPQITVTNPLPSGGIYTIIVEDSKGCSATTTITVAATPPPVYTVSQTNVKCYNDTSGAINFNVTNANGYTLAYSINNGATYLANPTFSNLSAGTYNAIVKYALAGTDCFSTAQTIAITQPSTALTASAGVSELAGCGPSGEGKIRITNPQGGTVPYEYSFDNQATWTTANEAYKASGTYTVYIRDANGCIFAMPNIVIDPVPVEPTIAVEDPVYNCDGTAKSNVTVTTVPNANYSYQHLLDGVANTNAPSNVFTNLTTGNHTISVKYISTTSALSCIPQSDFFIVVPSGNAFTASISGVKNLSCSGTNNGEITIAAQNFDTTKGFQYSIDNGVNWFTQMTSPYTITGLANGTYNVKVRYDVTSTGSCVQSFTQILTAPAPLVTTAGVTSLATCTVGATITASSTGGTTAYRYELWDATGTTNVQPSQNTGIFTNVAPGTYIVRGYDANNCTDDTVVLTVVTPPTLTATLDPSSDVCFDSVNQASLVVNASGGTSPYVYSLDGAPSQNSNTFNNVGIGTHSIVVTDSFGCTAIISNITIAPQLTAAITNIKTLDCTASPNAVITGTITGGNAPFVVTVLSGTGPGTIAQPTATTFTYTTAVASSYQFQIQDAKGCSTTVTASINPLVPVTATLNPVNPSCNGVSDGSVQIIPSGGVGPYTYSFNGSSFTSTTLYSGLSAGIAYAYEVRDSKNCPFTGTVTLTQPTALVASATATAFSCSPTNTKQSATLTIAVPVTGTAPYQYSFNGGGYTDTNTLTVNDNGTNQTIPYSVRDANGCTDGDSVTLLKLNPPIAGTIGTTAVTCIVTTSTVTVTPSAGTGVGTLTYEITFPLASATSNTTGVFTGLLPGTYIFKVTDANGCYYTQSHNVLSVTPIAISGNVTSDVLCKGGSTGAATYVVSGFSSTGNYTITVTTVPAALPYTQGQSGDVITLTNLVAGTYTVQVKDNATGCVKNASVTITEPTATLTFTATATNVNCNNDNSQITVTASGGTLNYTYAAVIAGAAAPTTYGNSNIITVDTNSGANLSWDVYVKDANGCIATATVTVISDALPTVSTPALASNQCSVSTGFTFTAIGTGIAPLSYSINGGVSYQSSPVFTVNVSGSYTVTVKDGNGCTAPSVTPTIVSSPLTTNAILTKDLTCSSPTDATIDVTTNGGKLPYSYKVKIGTGTYGAATVFAGNIFTYTASAADTYQFEIRDANGCTKETNITTTTAVSPTAGYTAVDPTCNGNTDGSIKLTALTGEGPFTYSIDGGATFVATNVFGGLVAGSYPYVVRDNKGCGATGTIPLNNPLLIVPNIVMYPIVCNANTPGSFDVSVTSGGVAPFTYNLYDNSFNLLATYSEVGTSPTSGHNFGGLNFGDYYITIIDAKGCQFSSSKQRITTPPFLTLNAVTVGGNCIVGATVDLTVVTGGVAPYRYSIFGQPLTESAPTAATTYTFNGLLHGTSYFFQVKDANNCISVLEVPIPSISSIGVVINNKSNVTCNGANNGIINYTVSGFDATVTTIEYELLNPLTNSPISPAINGTITGVAGGPTSGIISGLKPGDYLLKVKESTGTLCSALIPFNINQPIQSLNATISNETNANCNTGTQITVSATGGTGPYQYAFVQDGAPQAGAYNNSNLGVLNPLPLPLKLNWDIWVKDANGCEFKIDKTITVDPSPTIDPVGLQCFTGSALSITLTGTYVGIPTYSIGGAYQASPTFTVNAPGVYNVSIKDANGCIAPATFEVKEQVILVANMTQDLTCAVGASITLTPSGGTGTYTTYEVSFNGGVYAPTISPFITNTAGSYVFRVTDSQGCPAISNEIIVTPNTTPTLTFTQANVSCNGGSNGSIVITAAAGIAPYQYSIDNGVTFQPSNVFTGLNAAGTYNVIVKDSKNCISAPTSITITQPNALSATSLMTTSLSCGAGNAAQSATVTVTGASGTAPYSYSFNGGVNYTSSNTYQSYTGITFDVWVKDANGCLFTLVNGVDIPPLNPPTDLTFNTTFPVTCLANGTVEITGVTGGVAVLQYETIAPSPVVVPKQTTTTFVGLTPGTYLFQVTDTNGCTYQESYTVDPVNNITVSGQLMSNVTCNPGSNGEVLFTIGNFTGTYTYSINGGAVSTPQTNPTITVSGLTAASTQTIAVTDVVTGCTATTSINVAQSAPLALVANPFINANCNFGAQVSVTASGGVAPYRYSYVISGASVGTYTTSASAVLDPAIATAWDVYVKDGNGCVITVPLAITIATDPLPSGITVTGLSQCPSATGTYTFTVNVVTGMAPFEYSIGAGFQASPTFIVNAPGTYDVTVKDKNGCTTTVPGLVSILPALQLQAAITALPSCIDGDGALTLSATGGSGTYEYSLDAGTYQSSTNFTAISAGPHTVTVRDITTTCTKSIPVNLGAATPITGFALSKTDVSCNGGSNGVITATMATPAPGVNDNPVYNYSLSGTATRPAQTSNIFSGLTAGNYTVTVTSARGCVATQAITVVEPAIITVPAPTVSQFGCNAGSNATNFATITVTGVTGGSGVYNYEFIKGGAVVQFGASNAYTEANLLGGTYTVNVYDSKGCIGIAPSTISIVPFIALDKVTVNVDRAITCTNLEDITVSVSSIGGTPASLQYTVADSNATTGVIGANYNVTNTTGVFTGLNIGNYLITVANPATACSVKSVHYVNEPNTFDLTINSVTDVTCFGGTNGSANVTFIDRVITATNPNQAGPFSYTIVDALGNSVTSGTSATAGPITISTLAAGIYTITATLTNSPYCTASKNFTIVQPAAALAIAETHTQITCVSGNNDGSIAATATGGWPGGYQFELTGPVTVAYSAQRNFTNLTAGTYTVNVRDSKGCVATTNVTLVIPTPITVTASPNTTMLSCFGDKTATITVNSPSGGQGSNYRYTLNTTSLVPATASGPQASPVFGGLGAGTYTITVTDGYSCSATSTPIVIAQPTKVSASLVVATTQTCLTQTRLTLSATGGTGIYTYGADSNFATNLGTFTNSITFPVPVGTYHYYVKDANGCVGIVSNDIEIAPLETLILNVDTTNAVINCKGDVSGVIVANAQGGLGNYVYTLLDGAGLPLAFVPTQTSPGTFTQLPAGNYKVRVDSGDCTTTTGSPIVITEPLTSISAAHTEINVTCFGQGNGQITVTASGGTGIIKYAISPRLDQFFDSGIFINLQPGLYDVIAQDENGCYQYITGIVISEPNPIIPSLIAGSMLPEICFGDKDGAFSVDIVGGTMPYSVSLDNVNGVYTTGTLTQTRFDFTGLAGGTHTVYIQDANGCAVEFVVVMPESVKINPIAVVDYSCVNNSASNSVTVTVDASITDLTDVDYSLDGTPYQAGNIFTNVVPGTNHFIDVRHTNGCIQRTANFDILQVDPLALVLSDGGLNEIVATATGGGGGYQYTLNGESYGTKNTFIIYKSGDYTVEVTDSNGCVASATRYFEYIDVCIPNYFTPNGDGVMDGWAPGCTINYKDLTFDIFDRYGRKIATYRLGQYWDGKYNGNELPSGDYWYVLKLNDLKDAREFVGHFTLYR
ncbi:T9SS type B sorting domain-containing protein [Flavobacterium gawalongense]|uniref:T9SS type B sorting domain-containing protein n=1 Tax=Flavobacterium gawalongense TaxID=2594432 RepID=A0A553BI18_9FLAO|nr:T9SS type B sorting domain-containing protein [Flavobacterium gawalongense]TRX07877.1 T9SS type B sorting domain-containing protein [Flavobacterium gawalongense]